MSEAATLLQSLRDQRHAILSKVEGLSDEKANAVIVPFGWSLTSMVNHLALGESFWIRAIARGAPVEFDVDDPLGRWAWRMPSGLTLATAISAYTHEAQLTDRFVQSLASLDEPPARLPIWEFTHHWATSIRAILVHLIEETARHAGHVDVVRELLDGHHGTLLKELRATTRLHP